MNPRIVTKLPEYKFDFERIKKDTLTLIEEFNLPQIGLTHSPKTLELSMEEKVLECTGSIFDYESKEFKFEERDFTIFNEAFKSTSLFEMYQSIPNIGRFRIMTMDGPKCYTIHGDLSMRYHYVIDTNPDCLFLFPKDASFYHIPCDGNLYIVDTRKKHTFVNGSRNRRIHLVLDDLSSLLELKKPV
jgi:hypothetical protein